MSVLLRAVLLAKSLSTRTTSRRFNLMRLLQTFMLLCCCTITISAQDVWNFNSLEGWRHSNQGDNADVNQSEITDCKDCGDRKALRIWTHANTAERKKVATTTQRFGSGQYEWRIYIADMGEGDKASVGAFLYKDDAHELDFEIGSGTKAKRAELKAKPDEVLCYATCQGNPWAQHIMTIKKNAWHTFVLDLQLFNGQYLAVWNIDGREFFRKQLNFGEECLFNILCSLENLNFIGDRLPQKDTYTLFDYVKYTPHTKGAVYPNLEMKSSPFRVDNSYLSRHDIVFLSPTQLEAEGFPTGNGDIGGMIWTHDAGIEIQINKNDLWSAPTIIEAGNASILRHAARLKIDFGAPVFSWIHLKRFESRLALSNAEVSYNAATAYAATNIRTWTAQGKNLWVVECENIPDHIILGDSLLATVSLERLGSRAFSGWYGGSFPTNTAVGIGETLTTAQSRDILLEEKGNGLHFAVACRITDCEQTPYIVSSHRAELKTHQQKFTVLVSVVTDRDNPYPKEAAIALLDLAEQENIARLRQEKDDWYSRFWSNSFVRLGDDYIENIYYLRRYLMAAGSQGRYPVCFNGGLWRWNRDVLNWVTPHHWNTRAQYYGLCAQNDCQLMKPYINTYFKMIPFAEELAKEKGAFSDAILITEAHNFDGQQVSKNWSDMDKNYTPAGEIAGIMWDYYDYTYDKTFLRDTAYVFMKKAANFYLDKLQWDSVKNEYSLLASIYESADIDFVKNPLSDRENIESLFRNCIRAAEILNVDKDMTKRWRYVVAHLWQRRFEDYKTNGEMLVPADEYYTEQRYSPLAFAVSGVPAYPYATIGIDDRESRLGKAISNFANANDHVNAHYLTPVVAARMGMGDRALTLLQKGIQVHQMYPQGLMTNVTGYPDNIYNLKSVHDLLPSRYTIRSHDFFQCGLEPLSIYATAVNEILLQSNEGKIRLFPAIPQAWDTIPIAFTLMARGSFIVSALRNNRAQIVCVGIKSQKTNICRLQNPWPGQKATVYTLESKLRTISAVTDRDDVIIFNTKPDVEYVIYPSGEQPLTEQFIFKSEPNKLYKQSGDRSLGKESGWHNSYKAE